MREIDNSGSEIFPMDEEVKGGKNHKKIVVGSLLAPVLAVAAAGLITLAAVAEMAENGSGSVWDSLPPPPVEEVLPPEEPVIPPEEPVIPPEEPVIPPEEPEKKPEEPTTPPPTTPPPTTPPPTTPPPTTPPPTTPPPTTPPPFVPIYDPDPEPVVPPSFQAPTLGLVRYEVAHDGDLYVRFWYNINLGDADLVTVNPYVVIPDDTGQYYSSGHPRSFPGSSSNEDGECTVPSPAPMPSSVTLHLYAEYEEDGVTKTVDTPVTIPVGSGFTDPTVGLSGAWYIQSGQAVVNLLSIADLGDADMVQLELVSISQNGNPIPFTPPPPWTVRTDDWGEQEIPVDLSSVTTGEPITVTVNVSFLSEGTWNYMGPKSETLSYAP